MPNGDFQTWVSGLQHMQTWATGLHHAQTWVTGLQNASVGVCERLRFRCAHAVCGLPPRAGALSALSGQGKHETGRVDSPGRWGGVPRGRRRLAYPLFERSRTRNVCGGFCAAAALTEMNRSDSFDICMETTTLHAYIEGRPTNLLRKSCSCAEPDQRQKLRTRALHDENVRGGQVQP